MTTGRFCPQCGKDAAGAAFCPYCGASQAVTAAPSAAVPPTSAPVSSTPPSGAPAAPLNAFCPNCGAKAEPGLAFCTKCGANLATGVPLAPSQYVQPVGAKPSQTPIYVGAGAVVVALVIAFVLMSGGGDDAGGSSNSSASSGNSPSSQSSGQAAPTARTGGSSQASLPPLTPAPALPAVSAPGGSIGSSDGRAAAAVEDSMRSAGINMTGATVHVFTMRATGDQMLVVNFDAKKAAALGGAVQNQADQKKLLAAITAPPLLKDRRVTRLTININDTDPQQGPYTIVMTMPLLTAEGIAKGTITEAQAQQQIEIRTRKG